MLNTDQREQFWRDGYVVAENAITDECLAKLQERINEWVQESRNYSTPFGPPTVDGRARFDMGTEHTQEAPALRRVNNPSEISAEFFEAMKNSAIVEMVAGLIGPNVKFHHCKINLKLPSSNTEVRYHQDFSYTPHTNDDIVTALLMLDDVNEENGCLRVIPGSHRGPVYSLFDHDKFVGYVNPSVEQRLKSREISVIGSPGSVCLMHTRLVHGSAANTSMHPRGLYICVYTAADAFPIARNPMPNQYEGMLVRGENTRVARLMTANIELPQQPKMASFFAVQGQASAVGD